MHMLTFSPMPTDSLSPVTSVIVQFVTSVIINFVTSVLTQVMYIGLSRALYSLPPRIWKRTRECNNFKLSAGSKVSNMPAFLLK